MSSSSSTAQALTSLLPSHPHPRKLTHLADSLLAQSRQRAPNLKPEEEIARSYACAEIACTRLRVELRLPASVKARPPCKPSVYKKLLAFLDGVLTAGGEQVGGTPTRRASGRGRGRGRNGGPEVVVDVPASSAGSRRKVAFTGRVEATSANTHDTKAEAPAWTMPLIRQLCATFSTPLMPPHVYTGLCVVLKLAELWPPPPPSTMPESELKTATASLLIAIYLIVHTRMQIGDMTTTSYLDKCGSAVALAQLDDKEGRLEVEEWIRKLDDNGWCEGQEWFVSVPEAVMEMGDEGGQELPDRGKGDSTMEDEGEDPEGILLPGLGTMMQESVHWLSEERRSNHEKWRREILQRIGVR